MNPIVFMWSHPRSMSTATERIMRERGDFECLHEPFLYYYYEHLGKKSLPHFDADANHPREFDEGFAPAHVATDCLSQGR